MKNTISLRLLPALLALFAITTSPSHAEVAAPTGLDTSKEAEVLKFALDVGKTYGLSTVIDQKMAMMGQQVAQKITMGLDMAVTEADGDAVKKATMNYTRIAMEMDMMGQKIAYDSDDPASASSPLASMAGLLDGTFALLMDENNEVTSIEGLDEFLDKMSEGNPAMRQQMSSIIDEKSLKQMSNAWVSELLPDNPVKAGDSWEFSYGAPVAGMELTHSGTAKLLGHTDLDGVSVSVIEMVGKMDVKEGADGGGQFAAMGMSMKGGDASSILYWDNQVGYFRKMEGEQGLSLTMKNPQTGEEMTIPLNQEIEATATIK